MLYIFHHTKPFIHEPNGKPTCISSVAILFIQKMYSQKFKYTRQKNITFKKIH